MTFNSPEYADMIIDRICAQTSMPNHTQTSAMRRRLREYLHTQSFSQLQGIEAQYGFQRVRQDIIEQIMDQPMSTLTRIHADAGLEDQQGEL